MWHGYKFLIDNRLKRFISISKEELFNGIKFLANKYNVDISFFTNDNVIKNKMLKTGPIYYE